jgi:hypothetical protein
MQENGKNNLQLTHYSLDNLLIVAAKDDLTALAILTNRLLKDPMTRQDEFILRTTFNPFMLYQNHGMANIKIFTQALLLIRLTKTENLSSLARASTLLTELYSQADKHLKIQIENVLKTLPGTKAVPIEILSYAIDSEESQNNDYESVTSIEEIDDNRSEFRP